MRLRVTIIGQRRGTKHGLDQTNDFDFGNTTLSSFLPPRRISGVDSADSQVVLGENVTLTSESVQLPLERYRLQVLGILAHSQWLAVGAQERPHLDHSQ